MTARGSGVGAGGWRWYSRRRLYASHIKCKTRINASILDIQNQTLTFLDNFIRLYANRL